MQSTYISQSIIHVQNIFLVNPINAYVKKENTKYIIAYEPKRHTFHYLMYLINKNLINNIEFNKENKIQINENMDVDVSKILKELTEKWEFNVKNVVMRITPTKHNNLQPLYGIIYHFHYRKTGAGGRDLLEFTIPECPIITNSKTINGICYKLISIQKSYGGSHGIQTYLIIAPSKGQYEIGRHINLSNINNTGHRNLHIYPVSVTL